MVLYSYLLALIFGVTTPDLDHAIYISVMEVVVVKREVKIDIKIFSDDLSDALRNFQGEDGTAVEDSELIERYMNDKISLYSEGKLCPLRIIDNNVVGESNVLHFSALLNREQDIGLRAAYLMELFPTQQNIVKLDLDGMLHYKIIKSADQIESFE